MGSCSWPAAVASSPPPPRCCSTCSSGTDTSSFCQTSCPVWIGNAKQSSIYIHLVKTLLSLRFAAIFCPLKYHIHASCSTGKIVCFLTFLLTIGLTIMSKSHYLNIILPIFFQVTFSVWSLCTLATVLLTTSFLCQPGCLSSASLSHSFLAW